MSRPASRGSVLSLPKIEHPLSRLDNPERISIRGVSRASSRLSLGGGRAPSVAPSVTRSIIPETKVVTVQNNAIPDGIPTVPTPHPETPAMPIFGNRAVMSAGGSRASKASMRPDTQSRLEVDEVEAILKSKISGGGSSALLQAFKNNDPDGRGNVSSDALKRIISLAAGKKISPKTFYLLLKRLRLDGKSTIRFDEFYSSIAGESGDLPKWLDPIERTQSQRSSRRAVTPAKSLDNGKLSAASSTRELKPYEIERRTSISIERWLKDKFREGFKQLKKEFIREDADSTGKVNRDIFRRIIAQYGLYLRDDASLNMFLARCNLTPRGDISYQDLLNRFQDRSDTGIAHNILSNPKHRFNKEENDRSASPRSTVTAVEAKLLGMFQSDFLSLLGMFHKIDKHHQDVISQQEFRAAIESRFQLEISDDDFEMFLEHIPLDEFGQVRYAEFMAQFDTKKDAKSLWDGKSVKSVKIAKEPVPEPKPRTIDDIHAILRGLVKNNMNRLESEFRELDEFNSGRLTQEMLYQLLEKMGVTPTVSRGEIRRLWDTYIINTNRTLTFYQFVRHYGFSLKSAAFPNAKVVPPQRGDNDFMMRSRKLNCAADMLEDSLRAKVDYMWEALRRDFVEMDPYRTGFVTREEFADVLRELCVHLTDKEVEIIANKFDTNTDGRVSYLEFLRPFAMRRQVWKKGNGMMGIMNQIDAELPVKEPLAPPKGLHAVTSKLKEQLTGDWRTLRRAFQKMDLSADGTLTLPEFRSVLKLCNVVLDEDEVYHVLSKYDSNLSGNLDYKKFLRENVSRASTLRSNA